MSCDAMVWAAQQRVGDPLRKALLVLACDCADSDGNISRGAVHRAADVLEISHAEADQLALDLVEDGVWTAGIGGWNGREFVWVPAAGART